VAVKIDETLALLARIQETTTDPKVKEQLPQVITDLRTFVQDQETERNNLRATLNQNQATISQLQSTIASLQQANSEQARTIEDLKKQLADQPPPTSATPLNVATSFKSVIDTIQAEARKTPGVATTIKAMDIEVKGMVQVEKDQGTILVFPNIGSPIDANALSTLRVSFGAIPVAAPERPPEPPAPTAEPPPAPTAEPPPAPPPRRRSRTRKSS
jgi:hypothetical protein